jgi:hypothetical protein
MSKQLTQGSTPVIRHRHMDADGNPIDISLNSALVVRIEFPDGTRADKTGTLTTAGFDGAHEYQTVGADTAQTGLHKTQGRVVMQDGKVHNTKVQSFYVYPGLAAPAP